MRTGQAVPGRFVHRRRDLGQAAPAQVAPEADQSRRPELLAKVAADDTVIVSELSRLGCLLREVLALIEELIHRKRCRLILVKQGLA